MFLLGILVFGAGCAKQVPPPQAQVTAKSAESATAPNKNLAAEARKYIGVPYKFGGNNPATGFDCSGLVCWIYAQSGVNVPRTAREQLNFGQNVSKDKLEPGDIVVFKGTRSRTGWHSGLYTGGGKFIHSPGKGRFVTETDMNSSYFDRRFAGATRIAQKNISDALYTAYQEKQKAQATYDSQTDKIIPQKTTPAAKTGKKTTPKANLVADTGKKSATSSGEKKSLPETSQQYAPSSAADNSFAKLPSSPEKKGLTKPPAFPVTAGKKKAEQAKTAMKKSRGTKAQAPKADKQARQGAAKNVGA